MSSSQPRRPLPWPVVSSKMELATRIFKLRTDTARHPKTGRLHPFHILESPDWVNVVALTPDREMVLIRQYRMGTGEVTLEIPGGLIEPGDTPAEAALRELKEETGFIPGPSSPPPRRIGLVKPNPAFLDNTCYTYLVEEVVPGGGQEMDPAEDIAVDLVPASELSGLVAGGRIDHGLVLNALYWWELDRRPA